MFDTIAVQDTAHAGFRQGFDGRRIETYHIGRFVRESRVKSLKPPRNFKVVEPLLVNLARPFAEHARFFIQILAVTRMVEILLRPPRRGHVNCGFAVSCKEVRKCHRTVETVDDKLACGLLSSAVKHPAKRTSVLFRFDIFGQRPTLAKTMPEPNSGIILAARLVPNDGDALLGERNNTLAFGYLELKPVRQPGVCTRPDVGKHFFSECRRLAGDRP